MSNKFTNIFNGAKPFEQPSGFSLGANKFTQREKSPARVAQNPLATKINLNGVEYVRKDAVDKYCSEKNRDSVPRYPVNPFGEANSARGAAVSTGPKLMREREGAFSIDSHKNYSEGNRSETRPFRSQFVLDSPANPVPWRGTSRLSGKAQPQDEASTKKEEIAKLSKKLDNVLDLEKSRRFNFNFGEESKLAFKPTQFEKPAEPSSFNFGARESTGHGSTKLQEYSRTAKFGSAAAPQSEYHDFPLSTFKRPGSNTDSIPKDRAVRPLSETQSQPKDPKRSQIEPRSFANRLSAVREEIEPESGSKTMLFRARQSQEPSNTFQMFAKKSKPKLRLKPRPQASQGGQEQGKQPKSSQESFRPPSSGSDFANKLLLSKGSDRLRSFIQAEDSSTINYQTSALARPTSSQSEVNVIIRSQPSAESGTARDVRSLPGSQESAFQAKAVNKQPKFSRFGRQRQVEDFKNAPALAADRRRRVNNVAQVQPVRLLQLKGNNAEDRRDGGRSFPVFAEKDVYVSDQKDSIRLIQEKVIETAQDDDVVTDDGLLRHGVQQCYQDLNHLFRSLQTQQSGFRAQTNVVREWKKRGIAFSHSARKHKRRETSLL